MPIINKKLVAALAALLVIAGTALFIAARPAQQHPFLLIDADEGLTLTILQNSAASASACEGMVSNFANGITSSCPKCRIRSSACIKSLDEAQSRFLSPEPIDAPSLAIANGVIVFQSADRKLAMTACEGAAHVSASAKELTQRLTCFAPGAARPAIAVDSPTRDEVTTILWWLLGIFAIAGIGYFLGSGMSERLVSRLLALPRRQKQVLIASADIVVLELTLWLAFVLRLDAVFVPHEGTLLLFALAPIIALPAFARLGLYHAVIRHVGIHAMWNVAQAVIIYAAILAAAVLIVPIEGVPRSVLAIHAVLAVLAIGAMRAIARAWLSRADTRSADGNSRRNVVIYGAGSAGIQLANALAHSKEHRPVAFLDDDARLHRTRMGSLEVFAPESLEGILAKHQVKEILLAIPSVSRQRRNQIIELLEQLPVQVRTMPALSDIAEGKLKIEDLREVDIDDLLGRDPVAPDPRLLKANITGKTVMVTGAGGSIGSELCRQIAELQPKSLVLFEQSEFALYSIDQELRNMRQNAQHPQFNITALLGSVTDQPRVERAIRATGVHTIYHAAAYKHVPMVEGNPCEGTYNNVLGTYRTALAAMKHGVETFVLISTDKAVRPTNTMGATKRFAELVIQAFAASATNSAKRTRFSAVRFGNVLGSSGSVIPLFREQIRRGGPVTVTDPRIVRYFMTASEAAQLVIQASAIGDAGDVHVLDMGSPVKILDLAHRMIRLSGLQVRDENHPDGDISIEYSGLRPGEKLYEELLIGDDSSPTVHPRILRATEKMLPLATIEAMINELESPLAAGDSGAIRRLLMQAVEEFHPQCGNEDFLQARSVLSATGLSAE
jgi:FlaA1/EpsC-like NDP-sugar epimerase